MAGTNTQDTDEPRYSDFFANLAADIPETVLNILSERVRVGFNVDASTMSDWRENAKRSMDLVKMKTVPKSFPFENSANVALPIVANAVIQFASRAYPAVISDNKPVKVRVIGGRGKPRPQEGMPPPMPQEGIPPPMPQEGIPPPMPQEGMPPPMPQEGIPPPMPQEGIPPPMPQMPPPMPQMPPQSDPYTEMQKKAERVANYMSYQLLEEQTEWESDTDRLLHIIASIGVCWRKQYFCPSSGRIVAELVHPDRITINNAVTSLERMPRITERIFLYPWEIKERQMDGRFLDIDISSADPADMDVVGNSTRNSDDPPQDSEDDMAPHALFEQHTRYDLDGDGYEEPYVITWHSSSQKIVRVVRNWDEEKGVSIPEQRYTYYGFLPDPSGEFLGIGLGQLMLSLGRAGNSLVNQLLDAGTLANAGGGFIDKRSRIRPQMINGHINKWIVADIDPQTAPFVPFPRPTPDGTLFSLLGFLIDSAKEASSTTELMTGDLTKNMQPTTVLAMIEQGTKVFNSIYKRVYRSLKHEYKNRLRLNFIYGNPVEYFEFQNSSEFVLQQDFDPKTLDIIPASDPNMVSDSMEMARAGVIQSTMAHPNVNQPAALRRIYQASQIDPDGLVVDETPPDPKAMEAQAKIEADQRRIENETRRVEAEINERMSKIQREEAKIQMELASGPHDIEAQRRRDVIEEQKALLELQKLEIEKLKLELEAAKIQVDMTLAGAAAADKQASAQVKIQNADTAETKAAFDILRGERQEDRADRDADRNDRNEIRGILQGKEKMNDDY